MRKCQSCNHFCGVEQGEPELNLDLEETGEEGEARVAGDVRLVLNSSCCGDEIAESTQEVPDDAEFKHPLESEDGKHSVEIADESADTTCTTQGKGRGTRTFYGADVTLTLKCKCGWSKEVKFHVDEQASAFDEV